MITIYLGDITDYLRQHAVMSDSDAQLITEENYKNLESGTYFTSLGDLTNLTVLGNVLQQADRIVYSPPPDKWSDSLFGKSQMQTWTEDYLNIFRFRCKVENYANAREPEFDQILTLADTRKTDSSQLWIAGCSITHGQGVSHNTRYGQLLADRLDTDVSFLTLPGSSIAWAADQILRSDIRPRDVVVWGITSHTRLTKFEKNEIRCFGINHTVWKQTPSIIEYLASDQALYHSVISVHQVINFCTKINAKLILASLFDQSVINYIQDFPNLVMLNGIWGRDRNNMFIDIGTDLIHPGIKTHAFYADQIYQKIQTLVAPT
jgi:hypothetical protein